MQVLVDQWLVSMTIEPNLRFIGEKNDSDGA